MVEVKERLENGIDVLSISNSHLTVEVTNFGCTLLKIVRKIRMIKTVIVF